MSKVEVIVSGNIREQEMVDTYKAAAGSIMKKYNATMPPQSYKVSKIFAGNAAPSFMLKIEFPNKEKAELAFNDPDYVAVINERDKGFGDLSIFIIE